MKHSMKLCAFQPDFFAEQLKHKAPFKIKYKFLDDWHEIKAASYLSENQDNLRGIVGKMNK